MTNKQTGNSYLFILILVGIVASFGPFVTDFYLPALPAMTGYFHTTPSMLQLSITFSLIGLAVGQLFIGPLSDMYGRKQMLLLSLILFFFSTLGAILAPGVSLFLAMRLLQGLFGAGGIVISKSIATDLYGGKDLARFFSMLSAVQGLAPICAPVLGGVLLEWTDWRGIFCILMGLSTVLIVMLCFFKESLRYERRLKGSVLSVFGTYKPVVQNGEFMYYVMAQGFSMGTMFTYIAASPFIFQEHYGLSSLAYSLCFGVNALAIMVGSFFVMRYRSQRRGLLAGCRLFLGIGVAVAVILLLNGSILLLEVALIALLFSLGMILPTSTTLALKLERNNSGSASAILGFMVFLMGGIASPLAGMGNMIVSTSILIIFFCILTLASTLMAYGHKTRALSRA